MLLKKLNVTVNILVSRTSLAHVNSFLKTFLYIFSFPDFSAVFAYSLSAFVYLLSVWLCAFS